MSKPAPRQNFLQTFLIVTTLFLGFNLLFNKPAPNPEVEKKTSADFLKDIRENDALIQDVKLGANLSLLKNKVGDELKAKKLTQEEADARELEGDILLADTQLKGSILRLARGEQSDGNLLQNSYLMSLRNVYRKFEKNPIWKTMVVQVPDVSQNKLFGWKAWTGEQIYNDITKRLDTKYRSELLLGFVPGFQVIDFLVHLTGAVPAFSYAFAALLLALIVRGIVYPLSQKQLMWSRQMQQLQPLVAEIKKQYTKETKDPRTGKKVSEVTDTQELQMKTMALYKEYGINPLAGCGPALLQTPLFLVVYQCMLHYQFEFQKGTFLWMSPGPSKASGGFFAANLGQQDYIMVVLYGITMVISTLLTPVSDPSQVKQQRMMGVGLGVLFTVAMLFGIFPVPGAFVLYWTFTNLLATAQSLRAYRMPPLPLVKVNAAGGGVFPTDGGPARKKKMSFTERLQDEMRQKYEAAQAAKEQKGDDGDSGGGSKKPGSTTIIPPEPANGNGRSNGKKPGSTGQGPKHKPKKRQPNPGSEEV